jgi:hypothetical protein
LIVEGRWLFDGYDKTRGFGWYIWMWITIFRRSPLVSLNVLAFWFARKSFNELSSKYLNVRETGRWTPKRGRMDCTFTDSILFVDVFFFFFRESSPEFFKLNFFNTIGRE